jgi:DNA-binding transcriptional LysR family regulator
MLDVKRLRVLKAVADHGSFSAAAESLAYTQSAVSQSIAALERETGTSLLDRSPRGVRTTPAGEALVRHADAILCRLAEAEAELEAIAGLRAGRVRLATFPSAAATLVPAAVAEFERRHPGVDVQIGMAEPLEAVAEMRAGEHDVALSIDGAPGEEDLDRTHLLDDPMYVVLPKDHPLVGRARVRLSDLAEERWMLGSTGTCPDRLVFIAACHKAGFEPDVQFQTDDYNAIQGFVAAGAGPALIPDLALVNLRDDVVVRSLTGQPPTRRIFAVTTPTGRANAPTAALVDVLVDTAAELRATRPSLVAAA